LAEPLVVHGLATWRGAREPVAAILARVGLDPGVARRYPHEFSGGQRQRIAIARAVIGKPALVVADEPLSALDISVQGQILDLFASLQETLGLTYVFISHDLPVVRHIAGEAAVMLGGRIVEQGEPEPMFLSPVHPYTRALLDAVPIPDPRLQRQDHRGAVAEPGGDATLPVGCPFVPRCPHAMPICGHEMPALRHVAANWKVACWLHEVPQ
jgi:oligopeptide/dipeptide ABC transporter ATP-binding protein